MSIDFAIFCVLFGLIMIFGGMIAYTLDQIRNLLENIESKYAFLYNSKITKKRSK